MNITVQLQREHVFLDQIRRKFVLLKGASLTGDLRLFTSTWPFGVFHHEHASSLGVEFAFPYEGKRWLYRGYIDCRHLWPAPGAPVKTSTDSDTAEVGPLIGMRDDREDYHYILPDGEERCFRLKYVGFECWVSYREQDLKVRLKHFLPGDGDVMVSYSLPVEDVLFLKERELSYDVEGFLEDVPDLRPFVRIEACATNQMA
jgi:hypothetical protein